MQRKIEGVWNGETFEIQDMFANRADVYASNAVTAALLTLDPEAACRVVHALAT